MSTTARWGGSAATASRSSVASRASAVTRKPPSARIRATPWRMTTESSATIARSCGHGVGIVARMRVPRPASLSTSSRPPTAVTGRPGRAGPNPRSGSAPPWPSSLTSTSSVVARVGDADRRVARAGVALRVRERLGDREVGGRLDQPRQPPVERHADVDGDARAARQRGDGGAQALVLEDRRVDPARQLAQLADGLGGLVGGRVELRRGALRGPRPRRPCRAPAEGRASRRRGAAGRRRGGRARGAAARPRPR